MFAKDKTSITYVGEVLELITQYSGEGPVTYVVTSRGKFLVKGTIITIKYDKANVFYKDEQFLLCLDSAKCCKAIIGGMW